jgi:succinylglutamate desuccinylase
MTLRRNEFQPIILQNALNLVAGVHGPGTAGIEFHICAPVRKSFARLL